MAKDKTQNSSLLEMKCFAGDGAGLLKKQISCFPTQRDTHDALHLFALHYAFGICLDIV